MPGPSKYNRKLKAKNDARKPAPSAGGRTASEAAFGRSQVAAGKKVSRSNLRQSRPQALPKTSIARRSVLAEPRVVTAIERLRNKYDSEKLTKGSREGIAKSMEVSERQARRERNLENDFLRTLPTRAEALDAAPAVRQSTNLNAEGTRVEKLAGATQVGNEPFRAVRGALGQGKIKRRGNQFTTPRVRRTERKVKKAKRRLAKEKRQAMPRIQSDSLNVDQERFAAVLAKRTGLNPGVVGAWLVAEQGGPPGDEYSAKGYYNFLNIGPFMEHPRFRKSPEDAANFTADSLLGKPSGLSMGAGIPGIVPNARGRSPQEQAQVILSSGWGTTQIPLGSATAQRANTRGLRKAKKQYRQVAEAAQELGIGPRAAGPRKSGQGSPSWQLVDRPEDVRSAIQVLGKKILDKWLVPTNSGTAGYSRNIYNLNPVLARQMVKLARATGTPITITSGYRSVEDQAAIDPGTNPAAPPGLSAHQFGMAADAEMTAEQTAMAPKFGLVHGEAGPGVADPPHTELTDPRLIKEALKYGPIRSGYAPAGVPLSEGDLGSWRDGGVGSGASYSGGTAPTGGTISSGGASPTTPGGKRKAKQESALEMLRKLGYQVTSSGIRRIGLASSGVEDTPSVSEVKRRYGIK